MAAFRGLLPGLGGNTTFSGGLPGLQGYQQGPIAPVADPFASSDTMAMLRDLAARYQAQAQPKSSGSSSGIGGLFDGLASAYGRIAGDVGHATVNAADWLGRMGTSTAAQAEHLGGRYLTPPAVTKRLGNSTPSVRQWWQQGTDPSKAISGNQLVGKPVPEGKVPVLSDIIAHLPGGQLTSGIAQHPGAGANMALARGAELATNPLTYVGVGGVGAHGAEAVAGHVADAAAQAAARETGNTVADWIAGTAKALTPEQQAAVEAITSKAGDIINTARQGGVSALSKGDVATVNEWAGNTALKKGVGLRLPGGAYAPLTTGEGPLSALSVGRHEAQSALARALLGSGVEGQGTAGALGRALGQEGSGPTKLGEMFGGGNSVSKAAIRGGDSLESIIGRLNTTKNLEHVGIADQVFHDLKTAAKGKNLDQLLAQNGGDHAALADQLLAGASNPSYGTSRITPELHAQIAQHIAASPDFAPKDALSGLRGYAQSAGYHVADQNAAAAAAAMGYGAPAQLSPEAAAQAGLAQSAENQAQATNAAAASARATQSPKAIAEAEQAGGGAPAAASYSAAGQGAPTPPPRPGATPPAAGSTQAAQAATGASGEAPQALGLQGLDTAPPAATAPAAPRSVDQINADLAKEQSNLSRFGSRQPGVKSINNYSIDLGPSGQRSMQKIEALKAELAQAQGGAAAANLPGTVGPGPSRLEQALAAAQAAPDHGPTVKAALDALHSELQATKETLALHSDPNKLLTPDKVKLWAHARNLGIDTSQSIGNVHQALTDAVRQGEARAAAASPALDAGRQVEAAQQAATHSTVDESHAALAQHAAQLQEHGVPNTPQGDAAVKANSTIDEANLRAKDPAYAQQQTAALQHQLGAEAQAGQPGAADQLHQSQQWQHVAATSSDPAIQQTAHLNQVALDAGHAADQAAGRVKFQADTFNRMLADKSGAAERVGQQIYKQAHDFAAHSIITPGIQTPHEVAAILQRVAEETYQPGKLMSKIDAAVRGYKVGSLATPGFQSRLILGHAFMNVLARVSPATYATYVRDLANDGARYADNPANLEKWQRMRGLLNMGQFRAESGLGDTFGAKAANAFQKVNPLSSKGPLAKLSMQGAEGIQSFFRGALAHDVMFRQGRSLEEAAQAITRFHFNYSDASKADSVMKHVIPFYTFLRNNVPLQVQMAIENPKVAAYYLKANNAIQKSGNPLIPGLAMNAIASPLTSVGKLLGSPMDGGAGIQKELYGRITPAITGPAEFLQMSQSKNDQATKLFGSGNTYASGKIISTNDLHLPSWAVTIGKAAGLVHTEPTTGKDYVTPVTARLFTKALPLLAHARQMTSNEPTYANNRGATMLRLLAGIDTPYPSPTPQQQAAYAKSAAYDAKKQAQANAYDMGVPYPKYTRAPRAPREPGSRQRGIFRTRG